MRIQTEGQAAFDSVPRKFNGCKILYLPFTYKMYIFSTTIAVTNDVNIDTGNYSAKTTQNISKLCLPNTDFWYKNKIKIQKI